MAALCKALTKSAGIGLSITAVCKNAGKKTLGQDDFFVVIVVALPILKTGAIGSWKWLFHKSSLG